MTRTDQHTQSPTAPRGGRPRTRSVSLRTVLGSVGAVATVAGAAVLGVRTLAADDQNKVATGHPVSAEQVDREAHPEGRARTYGGATKAEPSGGRAPACWWTSEANTPVLPAEDLGGQPTPESTLIFEWCNGEWTGNIAWSNPADSPDPGPAASTPASAEAQERERFAKCVEAETRSRPAISASDDGLPNPWQVGSIAAKCYLERNHDGPEPRDP